jgi:hypothetical protein
VKTIRLSNRALYSCLDGNFYKVLSIRNVNRILVHRVGISAVFLNSVAKIKTKDEVKILEQ